MIPALPGDPKTAPPSYTYFVDMVERLQKVQPEHLTENSVLLGNSQPITDTLKKVEAAGFSEVILYFNVGMKPHAHGQGGDGPLHARGGAALPGQASGAPRGVTCAKQKQAPLCYAERGLFHPISLGNESLSRKFLSSRNLL